MARKKAPSKNMPLPASSPRSESEEEPKKQAKLPKAPYKSSGAVLNPPQSDSAKRPQSSKDEAAEGFDVSQETLNDKEPPSTKGDPQQKRKVVAASSDSDSDSESESDSEAESDEENDLSQPVQRENPAREPSVKPMVCMPTGDASGSSKKRKPAGATSASKKAKASAPPTVSKEKTHEVERKLFERFWSREDEMELLKLLVAFKKKHGREPAGSADVDILYDTAKSFFKVDFTRSQLGNKLGNLKKRFVNLLEKGQLPKQVDDAEAALSLAKEVWGNQNKNKNIVIDLEMNGSIENRGKSPRTAMPTTKVNERRVKWGKSKNDTAKKGSSSRNQSGSISQGDGTGSSIIDFVAKEFDWMDRDSLKRTFALLDREEWKAIDQVWNHLNLREMEFQIKRLNATQEIIEILKDKMDS